jgi:membrane protein YqaA with SNARE-associated domain
MIEDLIIYGTLFVNAFVAATLFPALSELTFAGLLKTQTGQPALLLLSVSAGNILGSLVNWLIGIYIINRNTVRDKFESKPSYKKARKFFNRLGIYSLLFAWLPIIGDPLTFIAGVLKVRFWPFIILVSIGKVTRYAFIMIAVQAI